MQLLPLEFGKGLVSTLVGGDLADEAPQRLLKYQRQQRITTGSRANTTVKLMRKYHNQVYVKRLHRLPGQKNLEKPQVQVQQAQFASFDSPSLDTSGIKKFRYAT